MGSEVVYLAYKKRRLIETLFLFCKDVNEFDETRVHSDHSVIATEFVNFLSTVLTSRLLKRFRRVEASDDVTYGRTMQLLERAKKVCIDGRRMSAEMPPKEAEVMYEPGLMTRPQGIRNPVGRPKKQKRPSDRRRNSVTRWEGVS